MAAYKRVAVAGATGNLGPSVVAALVKNGFQVVALSRSANKSGGLLPGVQSVQVDYKSHESLISALKEHRIEALVSTLGTYEEQHALIDASIAAGVKRYIPSEFGSAVSENALCRALPVFTAGKVPIQEYLRSKGDEISWTLICNSIFFDWGLAKGFFVNTKGVTNLYDDPDYHFSTTLLADVGQAVASTLAHPAETHNRTVYVQSASVSQNQILAIVRKEARPGVEFPTAKVNTEELLTRSVKRWNDGDYSVALDVIRISIFNKNYGADFSRKNDNVLLGIKELTPEEIEEIVKQNI